MASFGASSGDPRVDRRHAFAEGYAESGDLAAAIGILSEALDLVPDWAVGWFRLGEWHEAAGDVPRAIAAWERALEADPADRLGAGLKRDLARSVPLTEAMPPAFVEALFDQYAPRFEQSLLGQLGYCAPVLLADALAGRRFTRAMDLGCGTGLAGAALRDTCDWLEGCDISAAMLAEAAGKGIYDRLEKRDLGEMALGDARFDLIVAADVFIYLGALERILGWCAGSLVPGGVLAFTVEEVETASVVLQPSRRFAHSRAYLAEVLSAAGFGSARMDTVVLRMDRGEPVRGVIVLAEATRSGVRRQDDGEGLALA